MNKRRVLFGTLALVIMLGLVPVSLVGASEEEREPPECVEEVLVCEDLDGGEVCFMDVVPCEPEEPPADDCIGNPGNAKCVGKAGEKADMGGFWAPSEGGTGTHGRSDPEKHKTWPKPMVK